MKKEKEDLEKEIKKKKEEESIEIAEHLNCGVCLEIMHHPVSLIPCFHNFCGGCYSEWLKGNKDCPMCRVNVKQISRNLSI